MFKNEILIIGSGFSGSVLARELSTNTSLPITVVEKRKTVGGNMYDEYDQYGFLIQKYGPHILFTDDYTVVQYLSQFDEMVPHDCKMLSHIDGQYVQLPYSFKTIQQLYKLDKAAKIISNLKAEYPGRESVTIYELQQSKDPIINSFGNDLYEKGFKPYIQKQWDKTIDGIDKSIINRVQFQLSYVERYLQKDFQYLPKHGFTKLIENMLCSKQITIKTSTDALEHLSFNDNKLLFDGDEYKFVFYTGAIDELFNNRFGCLPYRSIIFEQKYYNTDKLLPCEICSYPSIDVAYTRKTEYKYFAPFIKFCKKTVVVSEYPVEYKRFANSGNIQCYPVVNSENIDLYNKYYALSRSIDNLYLIGRLANYEYINMDIAIKRAIALSKRIISIVNDGK